MADTTISLSAPTVTTINTNNGVFNVKLPPYNAVGDGVHDDTAAIAAAASRISTSWGQQARHHHRTNEAQAVTVVHGGTLLLSLRGTRSDREYQRCGRRGQFSRSTISLRWSLSDHAFLSRASRAGRSGTATRQSVGTGGKFGSDASLACNISATRSAGAIGSTVALDGVNVQFDVSLIRCNFEAFTDAVMRSSESLLPSDRPSTSPTTSGKKGSTARTSATRLHRHRNPDKAF